MINKIGMDRSLIQRNENVCEIFQNLRKACAWFGIAYPHYNEQHAGAVFDEAGVVDDMQRYDVWREGAYL